MAFRLASIKITKLVFKQLTFSYRTNRTEDKHHSFTDGSTNKTTMLWRKKKKDLRQRLDVDDVDQSEEEGKPVLHSGHVGEQAALRKYLHHWNKGKLLRKKKTDLGQSPDF